MGCRASPRSKDRRRVVDPTSTNPGQLYFGVAFDPSYAGMRYGRQFASGIVGSILTEGDDDYALIRGVEQGRWRG